MEGGEVGSVGNYLSFGGSPTLALLVPVGPDESPSHLLSLVNC